MEHHPLALPLGELSNEVRLRGHFAQILYFAAAPPRSGEGIDNMLIFHPLRPFGAPPLGYKGG